jgi:hypothetical protein
LDFQVARPANKLALFAGRPARTQAMAAPFAQSHRLLADQPDDDPHKGHQAKVIMKPKVTAHNQA